MVILIATEALKDQDSPEDPEGLKMGLAILLHVSGQWDM